MGYLVSDVIFERQTHIDPRLEEVTLTHKKMARANRTAPTTVPFFGQCATRVAIFDNLPDQRFTSKTIGKNYFTGNTR